MPNDIGTSLSLAFLVACCGFVVWRLLGSPGRKPVIWESSHIVTVADGLITHSRPDGVSESVRFDDLRAVVIETNDLGPYTADVFWILMGEGTCGCYIPHGCTGDGELLKLLQTLPGFDNRKFIESMGTTTCGKTVVWQRESGMH